jgi:hypothetical protein
VFTVVGLQNLLQAFSRDRSEANSSDFVEPLPRVWDTQLPKVVEHIHASEKFDDEELVSNRFVSLVCRCFLTLYHWMVFAE